APAVAVAARSRPALTSTTAAHCAAPRAANAGSCPKPTTGSGRSRVYQVQGVEGGLELGPRAVAGELRRPGGEDGGAGREQAVRSQVTSPSGRCPVVR
ncbi:hypothetical protein ABZX30_34055, partial [Streptomyces sp. NPDC004542]|uniref:hypothetical protein n=1 Tax=Streptomyces sp. NPDC004542 TaxID=3154281 RepID=UPI0033B8E2CC